MINKVRSFLLFPLVVIFSKTLKGNKKDNTTFISNDKRDLNNQTVLEIACKYDLFGDVKYFFDKKSPIYDKTLLNLKIDDFQAPEITKKFSFDFLDSLNIYHALSMLSARIPNENIHVNFDVQKYKLNDEELNHLLRYILFVFASNKVDKLYFDISNFDEKTKVSLEYFINLLNSSKLEKFSKSRGLYVLTATNKKDKFDIIWSKGNDIELTDFGKVFDKFGNEIKSDIKITNSPIVALHKS